MKHLNVLKHLIPGLLLMVAGTSIYAADINITCKDKSECTVSPRNTPLFSEQNIVPLWHTTKSVKISNNYNETRSTILKVTNIYNRSFDVNDSLAKVIHVTIKERESGKTIWTGTLKQLRDKTELKLTNIPKKNSRTYEFLASLGDVGNEYQGKKVKFDMFLGFKSDKEHHDNPGGWGGWNGNPGGFNYNWGNVLGNHHFRNFFDICRQQLSYLKFRLKS